MKLLDRMWRVAAATPVESSPRGRAERSIEPREPSRWNPARSVVPAEPLVPFELDRRGADPVWAETQPWYHD